MLRFMFLIPHMIFTFCTNEVCDWAFECGPWHLQDKSFFVRRYKPQFLPVSLEMTHVPIWISHIHFELNMIEGMSYIVYGLLVLISMDMPTVAGEKVLHVHVCVDIEARVIIIK